MTDPSGTPVSVTVAEGLALIVIDNPPVNALSTAVRAGILAAFKRIDADSSVAGVVLTGAGRNFIAGADIREMDAPPADPTLPVVVATVAACRQPVLAALNGATLGGGLEIALACDQRIAARGVTLGFPEVSIGIVPGAGGTQRLPRLVGVEKAAELIANGRIINAAEALSLGIVDVVVDADVVSAGRAALPGAAKRPAPRQPAAADPAAIDRIAAAALRRAKSKPAVRAAIDLVAQAATLPLEAGLAGERKVFLDLRASPEAAALRYLFLAERLASRIPALDGVAPRDVRSVAVVGGGTMGSAIAVAFADIALPVALLERGQQAASMAQQRVADIYRRQVEAGRLDRSEAERRKALIAASDDWGPVGTADIVIEAVFEDSELKRQVFSRLGTIAKPGATIATNTSYGDVAALARASGRPGDVIGLHFFAPANVMRLLELVRTDTVGPEALATGLAVARRLHKLAVVAGNSEGFIGNRIFAAYRRRMEYFLVDGAYPEEIDAALEGYGFAMGPFKVFDLTGLDIAWAHRKQRAATRDPRERYVSIADRLCEQGRFGRKSGRGWYLYDGDRPMPDPTVRLLIEHERRREGVAPGIINASSIVAGALTVMANEGTKLLAEGVAQRASDIDLVLVNGYGFPAHKGGPMYAADRSK